jgi:16S rRNA pseudouridine516 synthase
MALRRVDQVLSSHGYCSRSEARHWIKSERIRQNGSIVLKPDEKVDPHALTVDHEPLEFPNGLLVRFNKPAGYICTHDATEGPTIYELLPPRWTARNPAVTSIGRLDKDTTGILMLTDQGHLVQTWTSPRHHWPKVYELECNGPIPLALVPLFASGTVHLPDEPKPCLPANLTLDSTAPCRAALELVEGKYHQVKRMFAVHGLTVVRLHRASFGPFRVDDLRPGEWRPVPFHDVPKA